MAPKGLRIGNSTTEFTSGRRNSIYDQGLVWNRCMMRESENASEYVPRILPTVLVRAYGNVYAHRTGNNMHAYGINMISLRRGEVHSGGQSIYLPPRLANTEALETNYSEDAIFEFVHPHHA